MEAQDQEPAQPLGARIRNEIADWAKTLAWVIPTYLIFTTVAFANYSIPSESMVPTLQVGDRVVVSKFAYGYSRHSLPLNLGSLMPTGDRRLFQSMPKRGDVIVFINAKDNNKVMIKRLIGLPGDRITVRNGVLRINGETARLSEGVRFVREAYQEGPEDVTAFEETLPGGVRHKIHEFPQGSQFD
ncbi:MAG: signal peptidase I, partial [Caulobacterales bacterium]